MEMKFTENTKLNNRVSQIINELKNEIVSRFHPKSIILTGSFGRGEVTVTEEGGKLKFLSDCEIIIIPYKWIFNRKEISKFEQEFYKKYGLKVEIWGFVYTLYLLIPFFNRRIKPSIANYDLKYGSKVIYGENYLKKIPAFKPEDIPVWEGIKLIFNRMAEALKYFSLKPTEEMNFWTDKIVLACQDSLLLLAGKYTSSYMERNNIFIKIAKRFNIPSIQTLIELSIAATKRKLGLIVNDFYGNLGINYWFKVCKICDDVFRYILKEGYNIEFIDYIEFQKKYMNSKLVCYTSLPFNNVIFQNFFRFSKKILTRHKLPTLKMIFRPCRWDHMIYALIPLVYFSLDEDLKVNVNYLKRISEVVSWEKVKVSNSFEAWKMTKDIIVNSWLQMRL